MISMPQFYFRVISNGIKAEDQLGMTFGDIQGACAHAVRGMPKLLTDGLQSEATRVVTQVLDNHGRTVGVIRASILLEVWRRPRQAAGQ
jgi:hypothetical protein